MAFVDQTKYPSRRAISITGVVLVHAALGYALVTGLAYKVIRERITVLWAEQIDAPKIPPPLPKQPPKTKQDPVTVPEKIEVPTQPTAGREQWTPQKDAGLEQPAKPTEKPVLPVLARTAQVKGDRTSWVTTEDYPASSIRDGEEGKVAISVGVGVNGRVTSCQVTKSSGYLALDEATCRYYAKRARFAPALTADGIAVESSYADGIRWRLPTE